MWGEVHILVGIAFQQAGPLPLAAPLSIVSHWPLDDANVGTYRLYHALGTGWRKYAVWGCRIALDSVLAYYLWHHPTYLICGLLAWSPDLDHILFKHWLHQRMFPRWFQSEWGLIITLGLIGLLLGLVIT